MRPATVGPCALVLAFCGCSAAPAGARSSGCVWLVVLAVVLALAAVKAALEVVMLRRHGVHAVPLGIALWGLALLLVVGFVVVAGTASPLITPEPAPQLGRPLELVAWALLGTAFFAAACVAETLALGAVLRRPWARPAGATAVPASARLLTAAVGNLGFLLLCLVVGLGSCLRGLQ